MNNENDQPKANFTLFWDGYGLERSGTGIFRYAQCIAQELSLHGISPSILYHQSPTALLPGCESQLIINKKNPFRKFLTTKVAWPRIVGHHLLDQQDKSESPKIFHGLSNFNIPYSAQFCQKFKTVLTVHDLIPFIDPSAVSNAYRWQLKFILPRVLPRVDRIVCVSHWTRNVLLDLYPAVAAKTVVIHNGIDEYRGRLANKTNRNFNAPITILYVSRFEKYKRINFLLEIVQKAKGRLALNLVTCNNGALFVREKYKDMLISGNVKVFTAISDESLRDLYLNTDVYVHASLYEGFGLPVSEAMSLAVPVVYQKGSAVDEIVGNIAGIPMSIDDSSDEWISAIEEAAALMTTNHEFEAVVRAYIATKMSWKGSAKTLLGLYGTLVEK